MLNVSPVRPLRGSSTLERYKKRFAYEYFTQTLSTEVFFKLWIFIYRYFKKTYIFSKKTSIDRRNIITFPNL